MSRQFDEYMAGKFEIHGEWYELVEPDSFAELIKAFEIKEVIELALSELMHDEEPGGLDDLLAEQESYIRAYVENLPDFDNTQLVANLGYLTKKNNLRIGDLESMLGISAGYISRTAKTDSKKKLSLDVAWKIAQLFEVDLRDLLETDLSTVNANTQIAVEFIEKLLRETDDQTIEWKPVGSSLEEPDEMYILAGVTNENGEEALYHPAKKPGQKYYMIDTDIFACEDVHDHKTLIIVPVYLNSEKKVRYDFLFVDADDYRDLENTTYSYEKVFFTSDDSTGTLDIHAEKLYKCIQRCQNDIHIKPEIKSDIAAYLKREDS